MIGTAADDRPAVLWYVIDRWIPAPGEGGRCARAGLADRLASTLAVGPVLPDPGGEEGIAGENDA